MSLVDTINTGNGGNPNLKPIRAAVIDGALEYYYGPASVVAVSVFHDDLQSYVTFGNYTQNYLNMLTNTIEPFVISAPSNIGGQLSGVEMQVQQPIAYGFGFQANGTYINGHDDDGNPLVGTSSWTGNVVGYYENKWVSARVAYTYRSHFFVGLDRSSAENQNNYGTLDASVDFNVTPNVAITFDALNITNSLLKYYGANTTQVRAVYDNGTQLFVGVTPCAKFLGLDFCRWVGPSSRPGASSGGGSPPPLFLCATAGWRRTRPSKPPFRQSRPMRFGGRR